MARGEVVLNEPIDLGMTILEYSKQHMYHFFYKVLKPLYGDRASFIYTYIGSLVLNVQTEDPVNDYQNYKQHIDLKPVRNLTG